MKHTKGPWIYDTGNSQVETANADRFIICDICREVTGDLNGRDPNSDPSLDGHLIAASPILLEALEHCMAYFKAKKPKYCGIEDDRECSPFNDAIQAIAKAKGDL